MPKAFKHFCLGESLRLAGLDLLVSLGSSDIGAKLGAVILQKLPYFIDFFRGEFSNLINDQFSAHQLDTTIVHAPERNVGTEI